MGALNFGFGQIITFDFAGNVGDETSVTSNTNDIYLTTSTITRGAGLVANNNLDSFNSQNWNITSIEDAVVNDDYVEFTISPKSGFQFDVTTIVFDYYRSLTGPTSVALRSSLDGYATNLDGEKSIIDNTNLQTLTFTVNQPTLANSVTYRFYGYAEDAAGSGRFESGGSDIVVNGAVTALPACSSTTTWTISGWSAGAPTIGDNAIIATDYNTGADGSISACSLTVDLGVTLSIGDIDNGALSNTYVVVQNNVIVNGTILMNSKANFVQLNDGATVTGIGTCRVEKNTAPMNAWYEYTYWSSPVFEPQIDVALTDSEPSRRYKFNGENYLDAYAESNNNNDGTTLGQDGIDDNKDDWQWVNGTTVMKPGVGYAATLTEFAYSIAPGLSNKTFKSTFIGLFNNGIIPVPVYRNDSELNDENWNFIGNPYPSAIDADLFLTANTNIAKDIVSPKSLNGAIFLWSQNTDPSPTENGNEVLNFSTSDYAIINGIGQAAGGDGLLPSRKIPSGQGFFVSVTNSGGTNIGGDIWTTDVIFNNSMRLTGASDNSQFFKGVNTKAKTSTAIIDKLWINLTSDNGVFNQTMIGYANGATNNDDGMYYDTVKNLSAGAAAILYSIIEGSDKVYAIQGKSPNSL
ncbi:MAG: hypothetical protein CO117_14610, partial [Flavobacteriaceae bacterium CG_4_9_14_3_um_filter_33_16]